MLRTEKEVTRVIGKEAASSYIARHCGGPPWFERVSALQDFIDRGCGPEVERQVAGEMVYATADLVRWAIEAFATGDEDDQKEMLGRYLKGDGELCWRSSTAETVLVDF
jgi:hypothetical protein